MLTPQEAPKGSPPSSSTAPTFTHTTSSAWNSGFHSLCLISFMSSLDITSSKELPLVLIQFRLEGGPSSCPHNTLYLFTYDALTISVAYRNVYPLVFLPRETLSTVRMTMTLSSTGPLAPSIVLSTWWALEPIIR